MPEQIALNRIDPVAQKFLQLDPRVQPKPDGNTEQHGSDKKPAGESLRATFFNDYNLHIDHRFSTAFRLNGSYTMDDLTAFQPLVHESETDDSLLRGSCELIVCRAVVRSL